MSLPAGRQCSPGPWHHVGACTAPVAGLGGRLFAIAWTCFRPSARANRYGPTTWNGGSNPKLVGSKVVTLAAWMAWLTGAWQHRLGGVNVPRFSAHVAASARNPTEP